jgi:hypothetical protein
MKKRELDRFDGLDMNKSRYYAGSVHLLAVLKSWKLCKVRERDSGFQARLQLTRGNTAMHKRKLHIMADCRRSRLTHGELVKKLVLSEY